MLIMCWNVAGLSTTVNRIHASYGTTRPTKKRSISRANVVLAEYLRRHSADIFCVQEHKIPLSQLSSRSEPHACSEIEGYESFWSCCVDPSKKGLNGVVTYVKTGTIPVLRAHSRPLGSDDLDDQGRCVMTDHGHFVLFNVYAPANSGQPLSYKMKFLNALRRAMQEQRKQHNKHVILVGDLNVSRGPRDIYWADRVLFVNDIRREVADALDTHSLPLWKKQLALAWPHIEGAMATRKVVSTQTTNTLTKQKYDKYRMTVQVNDKQIWLGSHESAPEYCEYCYNFESWAYTCADTNERILAQEENVIAISVLSELMIKIARVEWNESLQRIIAATAGESSRVSPSRCWLNAILEEDGMVDAFRSLYPKAEGRYTCWNQFTNRRYANEGARIDYTLVDKELSPWIREGDVNGLRCGCLSSSPPSDGKSSHHDPDSELAALCAATAGGRFQPVSFEGGGIIEANQATLDTQFGPPHTGMIYTPPSFSDHTAISLLLDDECCRVRGETVPALDDCDPQTRKAQPHKSQMSISSFFRAPTSPKSTSKPSSKNAPGIVLPKRKIGIKNYFQSKHASQQTRNDETVEKKAKVSSSSEPTTFQLSSTVPKVLKKGSILNHFLPKT
jgi:exodeoxyribonuclease III